MQAKTVQAPETLRALEDLQGRARAMAIVHGKLYQAHDLARIDFGVYLKDLTSQLFLALGGRRHITLRVEADSLFISVDTAIPCGLIINELMTNALKYAFPKDRARNENRENEIRVAFCMDKGEYVLTVSDNGVGMPPDLDWRTTNSLGLKLVNIWATHQLEGSIKVDAVDGTAFTIKFSRRK